MNALQILIWVVALLLSLVVFLVMRYPDLRREQYRGSDPFSWGQSLLAAFAIFCLLALFARP